ncbi:hypothetical protein AAW31_15465 [Nitrosomonas communis]|uniref:Uncharacterized protein n=1 Tax=Nitrosomonas communis TaxID=44574 RepID=A0A0F7KEI9_9PROT|nr:hypothetical protein AAW31_15465 [Nitrosomonas communis]
MSELRERKVIEKLQDVRAVPNYMKQKYIPGVNQFIYSLKKFGRCQFAHLHQFLLMYDDVVVVL